MNYKDYNDNELIMYINENLEEANEIMYKKYEPFIKKFASHLYPKAKSIGLDLNDLIQEGMVGLSMALDSFSEKYDVCFYTFARTCIKRRMISFIIKASSNKHLALNESFSYDSYDDDNIYKIESLMSDSKMIPEIIIEQKDATELILNEVNNKLSDLEKQILKLKIKGYKYKEIGEILNKNSKTIDNAIQRIRQKLKNILM